MAARPLDGGVTAAEPLDGGVAARWRRGRGRTAGWRRGREGEDGDCSSTGLLFAVVS
jgi:hypothetical protein